MCGPVQAISVSVSSMAGETIPADYLEDPTGETKCGRQLPLMGLRKRQTSQSLPGDLMVWALSHAAPAFLGRQALTVFDDFQGDLTLPPDH